MKLHVFYFNKHPKKRLLSPNKAFHNNFIYLTTNLGRFHYIIDRSNEIGWKVFNLRTVGRLHTHTLTKRTAGPLTLLSQIRLYYLMKIPQSA